MSHSQTHPHSSRITAVLGLQWGDEGKGKLVDALGAGMDMVARFGGGSNAGHTIIAGGKKYVFHMLPSGALHDGVLCVVGNGCVVHAADLIAEVEELEKSGVHISQRIALSDRATLLMDYHRYLDGAAEEARGLNKIGTTKRGIGPAYADKAGRGAFRIADLYEDDFPHRLRVRLEELKGQGYSVDIEQEITRMADYAERMAGWVMDTGALIRTALQEGKKVLAEGGQAALLDIDHGTYPYVTSSSTSAGGICTGLGVPPASVGRTIGVVKAYTTRVGGGPFPTELTESTGERLREVGHEYGATTGRPRRCGWLDAAAVHYAAALNGATDLNITKLDVLTGLPELRICTHYTDSEGEVVRNIPATIPGWEGLTPVYMTLPGWTEDITAVRRRGELPGAAREYLEAIERLVGLPISSIGVGPARDALAE